LGMETVLDKLALLIGIRH